MEEEEEEEEVEVDVEAEEEEDYRRLGGEGEFRAGRCLPKSAASVPPVLKIICCQSFLILFTQGITNLLFSCYFCQQ